MSEHGFEPLDARLAAARTREADLEQRLVALVSASGALFGSPRLDDMMPTVVTLGRTVIPADGYAVWHFDRSAHIWRVGASHGVSEGFSRDVIATFDGAAVSAVPFSEPLIVSSVDDEPLLASRRPLYRAEGIASLLAVPLAISGEMHGTFVFYFRSPRTFTDVEVHTARALGNLAAAAFTMAELYEAQRRSRELAERANQHAAFLAEASAALASSLDYEQTLRTVASLAVPHIADWCAVDIVDREGRTRRLAVAHIDPAKVAMALSFQEKFPEDPERGPVVTTIRSGKPFLLPRVTDEMIVAGARSAEHLASVRALGITSVIVVPLGAHGRTHGALTFVSAESGRVYSDADLRFAQDVAYRSALAIENALAYAEANAANRAKDEFLATLSHELRTPLNAVLGWTRMLRSGSVTPARMARAFEVIERNATAQLELVEDLLDLSRIITGKFRLQLEPVHLSAAIESAVESVQPAATAKGVTLEVRVDAAPEIVLGDQGRLQQMVWNLLSNAIKFTPPGGRVVVTTVRRDTVVEIEVSDTGEGIEPTVLPYVFERFRQGESGTTRTHMGLGLGLAIVRHIVELHGGRVGVRSEGKGQGATFTVTLPAAPDGRPSASGGARSTQAVIPSAASPLDPAV